MVSIRVSVRVGVADCSIQTAGKSDKMQLNHVIKTDQWRSAPQNGADPHFVVSPAEHVKRTHSRHTQQTSRSECEFQRERRQSPSFDRSRRVATQKILAVCHRQFAEVVLR